VELLVYEAVGDVPEVAFSGWRGGGMSADQIVNSEVSPGPVTNHLRWDVVLYGDEKDVHT
jgi:hypothetical protein